MSTVFPTPTNSPNNNQFDFNKFSFKNILPGLQPLLANRNRELAFTEPNIPPGTLSHIEVSDDNPIRKNITTIPGISEAIQKELSVVLSERPTPPDTQITQRPNDPFSKKDGIEPSPGMVVTKPPIDETPSDPLPLGSFRLPEPDFKITRVILGDPGGIIVLPDIIYNNNVKDDVSDEPNSDSQPPARLGSRSLPYGFGVSLSPIFNIFGGNFNSHNTNTFERSDIG